MGYIAWCIPSFEGGGGRGTGSSNEFQIYVSGPEGASM